MSAIKIIEGGIFTDYRGQITSANNLDFSEIRRSYLIQNADTDIIRGWHGHRNEKKWFWCLKGSFTAAFVEIDDWNNPSRHLKPEIFRLGAERSQVICVPEGYANCFRANESGSMLMVFSSNTYPECLSDSWRYESNYWFDWKTIVL